MGAVAALALLPKRRAHPTATFELGDQAIKVDFKCDQVIKGRFRRSKFLIPVANAFTGGASVTTPCDVSPRAVFVNVTGGHVTFTAF